MRLWHENGRLVGWGWVTGGTELEFDVRPSHRALLDEILAWAQPDELLVRADHTDAIARASRHTASLPRSGKLYESLGFTEMWRQLAYRRPPAQNR